MASNPTSFVEERKPLYYLASLRLLICTACRQALILDRIDAHLRLQHSIAKKERDSYISWAQGLSEPGIIATEAELQSTTFPKALPYIPQLGPLRTNGLRCNIEPTSCRYIGTAQKKLLDHLRDSHNWINTIRGSGRPSKTHQNAPSNPYIGLWVENVPYQRLFSSGPHSGYFETIPTITPSSAITTAPTTAPTAAPITADLIRQFEGPGSRIRDSELRRIQEKGDFLEPNAWLVRLGAPAHLAQFSERKDYLLSLISLPKKIGSTDIELTNTADPQETRVLQVIFGAFDRILYEGRTRLKPTKTSTQTLFELNRKSSIREGKKPFYFYHRDRTVKEYANVYRRFFTYTIRTINLSRKNRPNYRPIEPILQAWNRTVQAAAEFLTSYPLYEFDPKKTLQPSVGPTEEAQFKALEPIVRGLLDFLLEVFRQDLSRSEYDSILVSFLAISAIRSNLTWEEPWTYTFKLSAITTLFKVVFYLYFYYFRLDRIKALERTSTDSNEAEYIEPSIAEYIVQNQDIYLLESTITRLNPTPYRWITKLRNYGRTISANNTRLGYVTWEGDTVIYKDIRLQIPQLFESIQLAIRRATKTLFEDLLYSKAYFNDSDLGEGPSLGSKIQPKSDLPEVPWASIIDDVNNSEFGYSFTTVLTRELFPETQSWLFKRILSSEQAREWFTNPVTSANTAFTAQFNSDSIQKRAILKYGSIIERFLADLAFLAHVTSGQASRGTELLSLRYRNTQEGGLRNVFIDRGLVLLVTGYHKGYNESGYTKIIHRFLPKSVGILLVYYLWLVLPFWEDINAFTSESSTIFSPYIWPPDPATLGRPLENPLTDLLTLRKPWNTPRLSRALADAFFYGSAQKIGVSQWRHLNKAITRKYLRNIDLEEGDSQRLIKLKSKASGFESDLDTSSSSSESGDEEAVVWNAQAGHSGRMNRNIYGRLIGEGSFESAERRATFRTISLAWHRFLGLFNDENTPILKPTAATTPMNEIQRRKRRSSTIYNTSQLNRAQEARFEALQRVDLTAVLREIYGPTAVFRSLQSKALEAIIRGQNPIIIVMATGSGKSLTFLLPAYISTGVSIIIVPLISLQEDLYTRATKIGIPSVIWTSAELYTTARLVFTTPETFFLPEFHQFIGSLSYSRRLDRIYIDECHLILEGKDAFRPRLRDLGRLGQLGVQIIYLTATLPPTKEPSLFSRLYWQPNDVTVLREPTTRRNIRYKVELVPQSSISREEFYLRVRRELEASLGAATANLGLVFCSTIREVKEVAEALSSRAYYSEIGSSNEKAAIVKAWATAQFDPKLLAGGRVIVTTNALGLGLDIPTIRIVVHLGKIYTIEDYSQESGRAGRDGKPSSAVVFSYSTNKTSSKTALNTRIPRIPEGIEVLKIEDYISGAYCRRIVLDFILDGRRDRLSCEPGEEPCDICNREGFTILQPAPQPSTSSQARGDSTLSSTTAITASNSSLTLRAARLQRGSELVSLRIQRREQFEASIVARLRESYTTIFGFGCIFCYLAGNQALRHSKIEDCPFFDINDEDDARILADFRRIRGILKPSQRLQFEAFSGCYSCLFPQAICASWVENSAREWIKAGAECEARDLLLYIILYTISFDDTEGQQSRANVLEVIKLIAKFDLVDFTTVGLHQTYEASKIKIWRFLVKKRIFSGIEGSNLSFLFGLIWPYLDDSFMLQEVPNSVKEYFK